MRSPLTPAPLLSTVRWLLVGGATVFGQVVQDAFVEGGEHVELSRTEQVDEAAADVRHLLGSVRHLYQQKSHLLGTRAGGFSPSQTPLGRLPWYGTLPCSCATQYQVWQMFMSQL